MENTIKAVMAEIWAKEERKIKKELKAKQKARREAWALLTPEELKEAMTAWAKEMDAKQKIKGV